MYQGNYVLPTSKPKQNKITLAPSGGLSVQELKAMTAKRLEDSNPGLIPSQPALQPLPQIQPRSGYMPSNSTSSLSSSVLSPSAPLRQANGDRLLPSSNDAGKAYLSVQDIKELTKARLAKEAEAHKSPIAPIAPITAINPMNPSTFNQSTVSGSGGLTPVRAIGTIGRPDTSRSQFSSFESTPPSMLGHYQSPTPMQPVQEVSQLFGQLSAPIESSQVAQLSTYQQPTTSYPSELQPILATQHQQPQPIQPIQPLHSQQPGRIYYRPTVLDTVAENIAVQSRPSSRPESSPRASMDALPSPASRDHSRVENNWNLVRSQLQRHGSTSFLTGNPSPSVSGPSQPPTTMVTTFASPVGSPPPRMKLVKQCSLPDLNRDLGGALEGLLEGSSRPSRPALPEVKQMFSQKEKERQSPSFGSLTATNLRSRDNDPRVVALEAFHYVISRDNSRSDVYSSPPMSPRDSIVVSQVAESVLDSLSGSMEDIPAPAPRLRQKSISSPFFHHYDPISSVSAKAFLPSALESSRSIENVRGEDSKFFFEY